MSTPEASFALSGLAGDRGETQRRFWVLPPELFRNPSCGRRGDIPDSGVGDVGFANYPGKLRIGKTV